MTSTVIATITDSIEAIARFAWQPLLDTPWTDWRGFWLQEFFDDRLAVCYFLLLAPLLLAVPRRRLRLGIILTGLAFIGYLFGALYMLWYLALAIALHRLGEKFAVETKRSDVARWGPPLGAWLILGVGYFVSFYFWKIQLSERSCAWMVENTPWMLPLGTRGLAWEPDWLSLFLGRSGERVPSPLHVFLLPHNIGTAYLAIRMLQYFSEIKRDTIPRARRSLLNFLAFTCYGPTLMQGPIERFAEFQDEMDTCHERRSWRNVPPALARIGWGLLKALIATWYFVPVLKEELISGRYYNTPHEIESYALLYFGVYIHIFWLYLEFSGYCDISAGIARLLGYRQIENFNWCWLATSLRDFWRRWHISLSFILRDYVYIALGGNRRHVTFNICATFFLIGVWHRPMLQLGVWGVVMGLMLALNQRWVRWMKQLDETPDGALPALRRRVKRLRPLPQILCWALTMHCFVHSLLIFFGGSAFLRVTWELIRRPAIALASAWGVELDWGPAQ